MIYEHYKFKTTSPNVCPHCKGRATKILNISVESNPYYCQQCNKSYDFKPQERHNICPHCKRKVRGVKRRRRNTQYEKDDDNFVTTCLRCFHEEEAYWAERWAEYYSGCM